MGKNESFLFGSKGKAMASTLLHLLHKHGREGLKLTDLRYLTGFNTTLIVAGEYIFRSASKELYQSKGKGTSSDIKEQVLKRVKIVKDTVRCMNTTYVPHKWEQLGWWSRIVRLQPDSSPAEALDLDYIRLLHSSFNNQINIDLPITTVDNVTDYIVALARTLQEQSEKNNIVIAGTDAELFTCIMEEFHRFKEGKGNTDIFISRQFFPSNGVAVSAIRRNAYQREDITSTIVWENLLFCMPMGLSLGLPPLLMLQYYYKESPLSMLLRIIKKVGRRIFYFRKSGSYIDIEVFVPIIAELATKEKDSIKLLYQKISDMGWNGCYLTSIDDTGWGEFRRYYYMVSKRNCSESDIRKRVISYICGLMKLGEVYRGHLSDHCATMRINDAPLASDILEVLRPIRKRYLTFPRTEKIYANESTLNIDHKRVNRISPWFIREIH